MSDSEDDENGRKTVDFIAGFGDIVREKIPEVDFSGREIGKFPRGLGEFKSLEVIDISHNFIVRLPARMIVNEIPNLKKFDVSFNLLWCLDDVMGLGNLKELHTLDIRGNPMTHVNQRLYLVEALLYKAQLGVYKQSEFDKQLEKHGLKAQGSVASLLKQQSVKDLQAVTSTGSIATEKTHSAQSNRKQPSLPPTAESKRSTEPTNTSTEKHALPTGSAGDDSGDAGGKENLGSGEGGEEGDAVDVPKLKVTKVMSSVSPGILALHNVSVDSHNPLAISQYMSNKLKKHVFFTDLHTADVPRDGPFPMLTELNKEPITWEDIAYARQEAIDNDENMNILQSDPELGLGRVNELAKPGIVGHDPIPEFQKHKLKRSEQIKQIMELKRKKEKADQDSLNMQRRIRRLVKYGDVEDKTHDDFDENNELEDDLGKHAAKIFELTQMKDITPPKERKVSSPLKKMVDDRGGREKSVSPSKRSPTKAPDETMSQKEAEGILVQLSVQDPVARKEFEEFMKKKEADTAWKGIKARMLTKKLFNTKWLEKIEQEPFFRRSQEFIEHELQLERDHKLVEEAKSIVPPPKEESEKIDYKPNLEWDIIRKVPKYEEVKPWERPRSAIKTPQEGSSRLAKLMGQQSTEGSDEKRTERRPKSAHVRGRESILSKMPRLRFSQILKSEYRENRDKNSDIVGEPPKDRWKWGTRFEINREYEQYTLDEMANDLKRLEIMNDIEFPGFMKSTKNIDLIVRHLIQEDTKRLQREVEVRKHRDHKKRLAHIYNPKFDFSKKLPPSSIELERRLKKAKGNKSQLVHEMISKERALKREFAEEFNKEKEEKKVPLPNYKDAFEEADPGRFEPEPCVLKAAEKANKALSVEKVEEMVNNLPVDMDYQELVLKTLNIRKNLQSDFRKFDDAQKQFIQDEIRYEEKRATSGYVLAGYLNENQHEDPSKVIDLGDFTLNYSEKFEKADQEYKEIRKKKALKKTPVHKLSTAQLLKLDPTKQRKGASSKK